MTNILLEKKGLIAVATINRPKALNALNSEVLTDLDELVSAVKADADIRALVITGSGEKAFVAGADIGEMSTLTKEGGEAFGKHGNDVFRAIETLPIPTIAAVNGFALGGGCELSMACDIRICADTAVFGQPETGLGITPGFGGTQRLARLVSPGMAKQLIYTAKNIKADEALRIGLVNAVYPLAELMPAAEKLAETIAKNAPIAVRACKKAIKKGGLGPCAANGANEEAVRLFLQDKIGFLDIGRLVEGMVDSDSFGGDYTLQDVYDCDRMARDYVKAHV